ncbi:hypothetical protein D3C77_372620 [compost metagenome]
MPSIAPAKSSPTCCASVGLGRPDRLALGAATGHPAAAMSRSATSWAGIRTATVDRPAVTRGETAPGTAGSTSVSGPGQKASMSARAVSFTSVTRPSNCFMSAICTISGLSEGRPLAAKIASTAGVLRASAPRPYTVSVGKATVPPAARTAAASIRASLAESRWSSCAANSSEAALKSVSLAISDSFSSEFKSSGRFGIHAAAPSPYKSAPSPSMVSSPNNSLTSHHCV